LSSNVPFIHKFTCMNKFYIFDVNMHKVLELPKDLYDILEENQACEELSHPLIEKLKANGFLKASAIQEIIHPFDNIAQDLVNNRIMRLTLQVTQQCNFRCDYCVYSGSYNNREHSGKRMELELAKKGIDFLIKHSKDTKVLNIGFYGGEPLLEIDLIKECIKYAIEKAEGKEVDFVMTTNGSLLNEEIVSFFLDYNVALTISLDGPKEIQDKNRRFINNCGTFDVVYNNLKSLTQKFPELKRRLNFNMVIDPTIQLNCLNDFVASEEDLFDEAALTTGFISDNYRKNAVATSEEFFADWEYNRFKYLLFLQNKLPGMKDSKLMQSSFSQLFSLGDSLRLNYPQLHEAEHHSGPCVPGQVRLFMDVHGTFYPCERVCESSEIMKIGNIDDGIDIEKVKVLLNVGRATKEECKTCFAIRECNVCAAYADDNSNKLSKELKLKQCNNMKYHFEEMLKDICVLNEIGFNYDLVKNAK